MLLTIFFKIIRRCNLLVERLYKRIKIKQWQSLYGKRIRINNAFEFGKSCAIIFDASDSSVAIGANVQVRNHFHIRSGNNGKLVIGNKVFFNNNCSIHCLSDIFIGDHNQFGEGVKMYDHNHQFRNTHQRISEQGYSTGSIRIGNNCWIGSNVIILKNVEIGDNVVIGAGCTIHQSVPSNTIVINHQSLVYKTYRK